MGKNTESEFEKFQDEIVRAYVKPIKTVLQMLIGLGIVSFVVIRLMSAFINPEQPLSSFNILADVSIALSFAAAIELAYMLFTPGPDEAVDPIILGIAALILSVAARADGKVDNDPDGLLSIAVGIGILVIALAILFAVRARFLDKRQVSYTQVPIHTGTPSQSRTFDRSVNADVNPSSQWDRFMDWIWPRKNS